MAMFQNKKKFHMSLVKTLLSYNFHEEVIDFLKGHWEKEKFFFFPGYFLIYQEVNHGVKSTYDYIIMGKKTPPTKK